MGELRSKLLFYRKKREEVHTPEEIKAAFDESCYAVCFNYDRGHSLAKRELFTAVWELNPDVMIVEADLCVFSPKPVIWRDQLLLINKNGTIETARTIARYMTESGIISFEYRVVDTDGVKLCFGSPDIKQEGPVGPTKGNLLIDGDKIVLTVRRMVKAEREQLRKRKAPENSGEENSLNLPETEEE